jgi:hydrogenase-4 membrane subunit HyfE
MEVALTILTFAMALCAIGIVSVGAIQRMILLYQVQSVFLVILTVLAGQSSTDRTPTDLVWRLIFAISIPGLLAYTIEPLLVQATVQPATDWTARLAGILRFRAEHRHDGKNRRDEALVIWLEQGLSPTRQVAFGILSLLLTVMASWVALKLIPDDPKRSAALAISLTLLMLGILAMISREDLISQIMGLLVMDHGLFLGTVVVLKHSNLIPFFVISLFLYILITIIILIIILPELHSQSKSIRVGEQNLLNG